MKLTNRVLVGKEREGVLAEIEEYPSVVADRPILMDAELIATGGFTPLEGFMVREDLKSVLDNMRLADGSPWTIPIVFPVDERTAGELGEEDVAVRDSSNEPIAVLHIEEKYAYDKKRLVERVFQTADGRHPGVAMVYRWGDVLLGGKVDLINRPRHAFKRYHMDPEQARREFKERGWRTIAGFQTRNPIHRSHEYIQKCAMEIVDGIFIHPIVGWTMEEDIPAKIRIRSYEIVLNKYYPRDRVLLAALSTLMRYAGPREAVFHAIVRRNFGCTHFIVGRDHAGIGEYYGPYDAHRIFNEFEEGELGITPLLFGNAFYCVKCGSMATEKTCPHPKSTRVSLSGTKVRQLLLEGKGIPEKVLRPEVAELLYEYYKSEAAKSREAGPQCSRARAADKRRHPQAHE